MHYCTASIRLADENETVVVRDTFRPVSWPEVEIIRAVHGDTAVSDVKPFVKVTQTAKAEKERLRAIYGPVVEDIFPGKNPQMELEAAGAKLPEQIPLWKDPVDKDPVGFEFEASPPPAEKPAAKTKPATPFV